MSLPAATPLAIRKLKSTQLLADLFACAAQIFQDQNQNGPSGGEEVW